MCYTFKLRESPGSCLKTSVTEEEHDGRLIRPLCMAQLTTPQKPVVGILIKAGLSGTFYVEETLLQPKSSVKGGIDNYQP